MNTTTEPRIRCGKCKGRHHTPAEVRACYAGQATQPTAGATPEVRRAVEIQAGRYAVDVGGQLRFFRVDKPTEGRWAGYTFVKEGVGGGHGDLVWHRMGRDRRQAALAAIAEAGPNEALKRFGQEVGSCGHCGRTLTDEESRNFGIGPVCRANLGW